MTTEKTLVIFKPDVLQRQIVGELLTRFERKGFKMVAMKMTLPSAKLVKEHYFSDDQYLIDIGQKIIDKAAEKGEEVPTLTAFELGARIRDWNVDYLTCGPVLAIVLQGPMIIQAVRKMAGTTNPLMADIGTIRADYSPDSYLFADAEGRTTRTILHASDSIKSAKREISLWFDENEIFKYEVGIEKILYDKGWSEQNKQ